MANSIACKTLAIPGVAAAFSFAVFASQAQQSEGPHVTLKKADPGEQGDGTFGVAAKAAIVHGPLPFSDVDVAAKAAANRSREEAEKSAKSR